MAEYKVLSHIDAALIKREAREARASTIPAVWPSEASAWRIDKTEGNIYGKCMRQSFGRMVGIPITNAVDVTGAWRFVTGRLIEEAVVDLTILTDPKIYVANGLRMFIEEFNMPLEVDIVTIDPDTKKGWLVECKTYYGYAANKDLKNGSPKLENIMQTVLYLNEIQNGYKLKSLIKNGMLTKIANPGHRNRIEADIDKVEQIDDGPIGAKLIYLARDTVERYEFTIGIAQDFDGSHYPTIDGQMWKMFTIESIYERYKLLQDYWNKARQEAISRLEKRGTVPPVALSLDVKSIDSELTEDQKRDYAQYLDLLEKEVRKLPDSFLPPAEYEWAFSPEKIELLASRGVIGKTRYNDWKKRRRGKDKIGDWQCLYCPLKNWCIPKQNKDWAYQLYDVQDLIKSAETEEGINND